MPRDSLPSVLELSLERAPSFGLPESFSQNAEVKQPARATPGNVPYQADFDNSARKYGVPANILMALAEQESNFNPTALGQPTKYGRAKGLMQNIDSTAAAMGINPYDPVASIDAAARQLKQRLDQGYSMQEAVQAHFGGDNRKQWGPKTRQYGVEVLGRAQKFFNGDTSGVRQQSRVETAGQQPAAEMNYPAAQSAMENMQQTELRDSAIRRQAILADLNAEEPDRYRALTAEEMQQWQAQQQKDEPVKFEAQPDRQLDFTETNKEQAKVGDRGLWDKTVDGAKDAGLLLMSGWNHAAEDLNELVSRIPVIGKPVTDAMARFDEWRLGKSQEETFKEWDDNINKNFSPEMVQARKKAWVVEPGDEIADGKKANGYNFGPAWSDPRAYASGLLESLPEMAITMGGSGRLAQYAYKRALAGGATREVAATAAARTATVAGGILEGGLGGAASARQTREDILKLDENQLKDSDALKALMDSGKTFKEARAEIAESAASKAFVLAGIGTGIFGGMGDRAMARIITGNAGRLKSALTGFIGEGLLEEVPQSALQQMSQNYAMQEAQPDTPLMKGVANQAAAGFAVGGLMGAGMGVAAPRAGRTEQGTENADVPPAADQGNQDVPPVDQTVQDPVVPGESRDDSVAGADAGPLERSLKNAAAQPTEANGNLWAGETGQVIQFQAKGDPSDTYTGTIERYNRDGSASIRDQDGTPYTLTPDDIDIVGAAPVQVQDSDQLMQDAGTEQEVKDQRQADTDAAQAEADHKAEQAATEEPENSREEEATPYQRNELRKRGATDDDVADLTRDQAEKMLEQLGNQQQKADRPLTEFTEEELRDRMRYLATQAKQGGWTKPLIEARKKVEDVLNAKYYPNGMRARIDSEKPDKSAPAQLAVEAPADQPAAVPGRNDGSEADSAGSLRTADGQPDAGSRVGTDTPDTATGVDSDSTLNGADGKPKWFTSAENAQKHLDKKGLTGYTVVEVQPRRFEMHREQAENNASVNDSQENVAKTSAGAAPKTEQNSVPVNPRTNRAKKLVGAVGEIVSPDGDVGNLTAGGQYQITRIEKSGTIHVMNRETAGNTTITVAEMERARSRNVNWTKTDVATAVAETVAKSETKRQNQQQNIPENIPANDRATRAGAETIPFRTVEWDPKANGGVGGKAEKSGKSPLINYGGRIMTLVKVNGVKVPFYLSTGKGGKTDVPAGKWYPFFGVGADGWINKTGGKDMTSYYGSEALRQKAQELDSVLGDLSQDDSIPKVSLTGEHITALNESFPNATENERADTLTKVQKSIADTVSAVEDTSSAANQPNTVTEEANSAPEKVETAPAETTSNEGAKAEADKSYGADNKLVSQDRAAELRKRLKAKFSQLNSGIDPEILAIGTELAVFHIEASARKFSDFARAMAADLDLPLYRVRPYLRSWYNGARDMMEDSGVSIDGMDSPDAVRSELAKLDQAPVEQETAAEPVTESQEPPKQTPPARTDSRQTGALDDMVAQFDSEVTSDASGIRTGLEPDSQNEVSAVPVNAGRNGNESGRNDAGDAGAGRAAGTEQRAGRGDQRVSDDSSPAGGERSDQRVYRPDGQFESETGDAGSSQRAGRGSDRQPGSATETRRAADVTANAHAAGAGDLNQRLAAQRAANKRATKPKLGDRASIDESLPLLLEKQRDDVQAVEARHAVASGILITNGTGTGKTASGLGVAKRFYDDGKRNIAVVVPTDKIANDWVRFAGSIGMPLKQLESITDNGGNGPVITTYANFGQNNALAQREWDLIIPDESHYLSSNEAGDTTDALQKLRALTGHHEGFNTYMQARYSQQADARTEAYNAFNQLKESDPGYKAAQQAVEKADRAWNALLQRERDPWEARWAEQRDLPKVVFLSATPFAYVKSTDYAEGYLFHHAEPGERFTNRSDGSYNAGDSRDRFYMQHFGYRMRYNRLTRPDAEVNSELMEQNFNQHLKDTGALIGRSLDVPFDYDRRFQLIEDAAGKKLDDALRYLNEHNEGELRPIYDAVMKSFDYLSRMFLLESMKARAAVPVIRQHLDMGRKVVVFHDYNKGGGFSPFAEALKYLAKSESGSGLYETAREVFQRPMFRINFSGLQSALNTLTPAFPDALLFNGTVSKAERRKNADLFNDDNSGRNLIIAQSDAAREGVSLHDTTGKHQRVEINLGMPTKPVAATQIEGRVYRTGQASDAIFRYLTTGTGWEASAFASKIAERASTAENLALGTDARGLKQSFIDAYSDASEMTASAQDGKGGKELDRAMAAGRSISPFDKAKTWYFAQQKNTKSRGNREGQDYYATPEPVGLKMVEWAGVKPGDKVLEPSAGHGAIARFIPEQTDVTMIEPSYDLSQRAALANSGARIVNGKFENFSRSNKYDAIVMNPPYGSGGKTAVEHMEKAASHLREGGRMVALVPRGGMTDRRLATFSETADKYKLQLVARVSMPSVTFERAGTSVATQVLVYEKNSNKDAIAPQVREIDLSNAQNINELFERIENVDLPARRALTREEQFRNSLDNAVVLDSWQRLSSSAREPSAANAERLAAVQAEQGQATYADKFTELVKQIEQTNTATNAQRVLSQLKQAEQSGQFSKEGMQLAQWLVRNYPHLADSLTVQLKAGNEARPAGNYNTADRLITLFSNFNGEGGNTFNNSPTVAVHEIMHHLERMMPRDVQESISTMWADALHNRLDYYQANDPARGKLLGDLVAGMYGDRGALNRAQEAFMDGRLPSEDYQYASPSEYWAENAADLIAGRAKDQPADGWVKKAVAAMRRIIERIKQLLGAKPGEVHPMDQYLDSILAGDGKFQNDDVLMKVGDELYRISDSYEGDYQVPGQDLPSLGRQDPLPNADQDNAQVRSWWDKFKNLKTDKTTDLMDKGLAVIPMRPLVQELGRNMPSAREYMRLKQSMDAMRNRWHAKTDKVAQNWLKYRKADKAKNQVLMDIMHEATITGVDPTMDFDAFLNQYMANVEAQAKIKDPTANVTIGKEREAELRDTWESLKKRLKSLGPDGQKVFNDVRDAYSELSNEYEKVLMSNMEKAINVRIKQAEREHRQALRRIKDEGLEGEALQEAIKEADKKLKVASTKTKWNRKARITQLRQQFETNRLAGVYFPLARFGELFVTVRDKSTGKVLSFSRFEKASEQREFADLMRKERGQDVQIGVLDNADDLRKGVDAGFVADIEDILADLPHAEKIKDEVWQRYLDTLPDYSVRTNRIHRTKRAGFNADALRAFGSQMFHGSHQLARLAHTFDMEEALNATREESTLTADPVRDGKVVNEMEKRHQFVMNPTGGALVQRITQAAFIYALAASPKAAFVNLSQTAIMGVPILGAYDGSNTGMLRAANQLNRALGDFTRGKGHAADSKRLTNAEREAMQAAYDTGLIDKSQAHDLAGIGETGVQYSPARTRVMSWLAWGFHQTERLNREVTFLAAYRMARAKGIPHQSAILDAGDLTWKTHFDYQNTSRPRVMHNDTMKALLVFRNFSINMIYRLFRDIHQSAAGQSPEIRREARIQLAGTTGMMMLSAGITGTWGYGILLALAGMFMDDDKDPEAELKKNMVEALGPMMTGIILDGAPGYATGTSLSDSIGMKDLWFRSPSSQLEGKAEAEYWKSQLLGAAPSMADNVIRGWQMLGKDTYRGIETMMPKAIKDPMKAYRYATEGATNLRGDKVVDEVSTSDVIRQALGFVPAKLAEQYDINNAGFNLQKSIMDKRKRLMDNYYKAEQDEDESQIDKLETQIDDFNDKYPEQQITSKSLRQSAKTRERNAEDATGGMRYNRKLKDRILEDQAPTIYR